MTFYLFYILLLSTALLICTENTFWDISSDGNFVDSFKKTFKLYVESGMRKKTEADIEVLRNEHGGCLVTEDFRADFYEFITQHSQALCKIHYFYLHLIHLTTFFL